MAVVLRTTGPYRKRFAVYSLLRYSEWIKTGIKHEKRRALVGSRTKEVIFFFLLKYTTKTRSRRLPPRRRPRQAINRIPSPLHHRAGSYVPQNNRRAPRPRSGRYAVRFTQDFHYLKTTHQNRSLCQLAHVRFSRSSGRMFYSAALSIIFVFVSTAAIGER